MTLSSAAVVHPACNVALLHSYLGYHPLDSHLRSKECFLRVILGEVKMKRGRLGKNIVAELAVDLASPLSKRASELVASVANWLDFLLCFFLANTPKTCQTV